jgi:hypothetical protein
MKTYRWIFLMLAAGVFAGCGSDSEDELVGDWQKRQDFPRHVSHAATFVIGDKGYVIGGTNGTGTSGIRREVFEFDHLADDGYGDWAPKVPFPSVDGYPKTVNDKGTNKLSDGFHQGYARQQAVGFALLDRRDAKTYGYVGAGYGWVGEGRDAEMLTMKDFWRYNPDNDTWEQVAPLPAEPRRGAFAFSLYHEAEQKWYAYVGGGYSDVPDKNGLSDIWQFDYEGTTHNPDGEDWKGKWTFFKYGEKRTGGAVFIIDNKAYICNGKDPVSGSPITILWCFDPNVSEGSQWKKLRTMENVNPNEDYDDDYGSLRRAFGVAYVANVGGQLRGHIVGGDSNGHVNWEYEHDADLWVRRTSFYNHATQRAREGMISFSFPKTEKYPARAFVGLGRSGVSYHDDMWEFIPLIADDIYNDF